jgi:hypothetical protein
MKDFSAYSLRPLPNAQQPVLLDRNLSKPSKARKRYAQAEAASAMACDIRLPETKAKFRQRRGGLVMYARLWRTNDCKDRGLSKAKELIFGRD